MGVYTNFYEHKSDHVVVLSCEHFSLTGDTDREIERIAFFPFNALPESLSPGSRRRIREYLGSAGEAVVGPW